jgi:hypothetical protein
MKRFQAMTPRDRAISIAVVSGIVLAFALSFAWILRGGPPGVATAPDGSGTPAGASAGPEPSFTPSPLPEASIVTALPPPPEAPVSAVIASPVAAAQTRPPATPTPSPDPNVWRVEGVIVEDDTKLPIREVCIVIGPHGCQRGSIRTDTRGVFAIDVPKNPTVFYDLYFVKDGFWTVWMRIKPEGPSVYNVALTKS